MNKSERITEIKNMISDIEPFLNLAQIRSNILICEYSPAFDMPDEMVRGAHLWIRGIYYGEFHTVKRIWNHVEDKSLWDTYFDDLESFRDFREVKLILNALKLFKKAVVNKDRPDFFKRGKYNEQVKRQKKERNRKAKQEAEGRDK